MSTGMRPIPVTVPADAVSLHCWKWGSTPEEMFAFEAERLLGFFGEQIGERLPAGDVPVTFPPHAGPDAPVHHVVWREGNPMFWAPPRMVREGDAYTAPLPVVGTLERSSEER